MKKVIQEPAFWLVVIFLILVAIIMYAPMGKCEDKAVAPTKAIKEVTVKPRPITIDVKSDKEAVAVALLVKYFNSRGM